MAGMQRFVTYIYAYENGQKSGNAGYAKIETRGIRGQIDIHFLNGGIYRGKGKVAFLFVLNGKVMYVPIGEFAIENGVGTGSIPFQTDVVAGTDLGFSKMDGIYIADSQNQLYLSFWKDVDITDIGTENFEEYSLDMPLPETVEYPLPEVVDWPKPEKAETSASLHKEMLEDAEQESLHTMEIPMKNVFPTYTMEEIWQSFTKARRPVQINEDTYGIQIDLSDLRAFPKRYWYLGNNSFLLHGFFNYHHLLLGQMSDGRCFLGVPGVYARQERVMASIFGFPGFMHVAEPEQSNGMPSSQVTPREKQQGIWYHMLED